MTQIGPILRETLNKWVVWASGPPPDLRGGPEANPKRDIKQRRPNMTSEGLVHSPCCTRPVQPWLQGVPAHAVQAWCTGGAQVVPCECAPGAPHACGTIRAEPAAHMLHSPCCTRPISPCTEPCTKALTQPCVQGLHSPCAAGVVHRWCTGGAHRMRSRCTCHVQPLLHTCCTALAVQGQLALVQSLVQRH